MPDGQEEVNPMLTEEILYQQAFDYVCGVFKGVASEDAPAGLSCVSAVPAWVTPEELHAKWYGVYMRAGAFAGSVAASDQAVMDVASVFAMAAVEAQGNLEMRDMIGEGVHAVEA